MQQGRSHNLAPKDKFKVEGLNEIVQQLVTQNDYEYDAYGNRLAVSDSDGNVAVYHKDNDGKFRFQSDIKAADGAIWKVAWAHPKFGELLAVATFTKRVAVFQQKNNEWQEVAYHSLHEGSVNEVKWAPSYYGLRLFACSSDGNVSVLEVRGQAWCAQLYTLQDMSINSLAVERKSLLDDTVSNKLIQDNLDKEYPLVATGGKDRSVCLWKHNPKLGQYEKIVTHVAHKDAVRNVLWRKPWTACDYIELFSCSEDGTVKLLTIKKTGEVVEKTILSEPHPIVRLSQSMSGNVIVASIQDSNRSVVLRESNGEWTTTDQLA